MMICENHLTNPNDCENMCVLHNTCGLYKSREKEQIEALRTFRKSFFNMINKHGIEPSEFIENWLGIRLMPFQRRIVDKMAGGNYGKE